VVGKRIHLEDAVERQVVQTAHGAYVVGEEQNQVARKAAGAVAPVVIDVHGVVGGEALTEARRDEAEEIGQHHGGARQPHEPGPGRF